eukprot:1475646-Amphidinium_carterae.1
MLGGTAFGMGEARNEAVTDPRPVTEVRWFTCALERASWYLHHSLLAITVEDASSRKSVNNPQTYLFEKCKLFEDKGYETPDKLEPPKSPKN